MKIELTLPPELVDLIVDRLFEKIKPFLAGNGKQDAENTIFDVKSLCNYLKVSRQWVYERTHMKEIPHTKINGQLRFRKKDIDKWLNSYNVPATSTPERALKAVK